MKKLSNITESVWGDIRKRSTGETIRKEDDNKFYKEFEKIKKMEFLHPKVGRLLGTDYLWAPCNFGAESYDQPGWYLNSEEILELYDLLKDTDYELANGSAFSMLQNKKFEQKKIGNWWYFIFDTDTEPLYIPNFGVYSEERPDKLQKPTKDGLAYYGCYFGKGAGYTSIDKQRKSFIISTYMNSNQTSESDKFQVRLVKKFINTK